MSIPHFSEYHSYSSWLFEGQSLRIHKRLLAGRLHWRCCWIWDGIFNIKVKIASGRILSSSSQGKKTQWAFAYTHNYFVAGVSSSQRQEMVNCQIKSALMSNSSLSCIIDGFDAVEGRSREKLCQASLFTKFAVTTMDSLITYALQILTHYAHGLLRAESGLSLSYTCVTDHSNNQGYFRISHKDNPHKFRVVRISLGLVEKSTCYCRKQIWHGIIWRHMLCCFHHNYILSCPVSMFNERWRKDFETLGIQSVVIDTALATQPKSYVEGTQRLSEDQRLSELTSLTRPILHRSIGSESTL